MTLAVRAVAATDQGLVRSNNEDAVFVGGRLLVVADGMGGLPAGELASDILVQGSCRRRRHAGHRASRCRT